MSFCLIAILAFGQTKQLTILHTNDAHSQIYPLSTTLADTMKAGRGGFVRRIAMLKEERKKQPDLLLFDSGDFCMDNMVRLFKMANFPIVCANYDFTGTPLQGLVKPYIILKRNGLKIGVFGLAPKLDGLVVKANYGKIVYNDPVACAQKVINELKGKKCDLIICISHLGWDIEGVSDEEVIAGTRGLDLVLGGHSHTYLTKLEYVKDLDGKLVGDDQNGKHAIFVGKLVLDMKKK